MNGGAGGGLKVQADLRFNYQLKVINSKQTKGSPLLTEPITLTYLIHREHTTFSMLVTSRTKMKIIARRNDIEFNIHLHNRFGT